MKKEELYEVLGDIREEYVSEAHTAAKKKSPWAKWVAVAASFAKEAFSAATKMEPLPLKVSMKNRFLLL